jgi:transcriptional regulator with XRE-family HTH domain
MDETSRYYTRPRWRHAFDWLDEVRHRPAIFLRDGSLRELETLVLGYLTAQDVHGIDEGVPSLGRHFGTWLRLKTGWSLAAGWAYAIETNSAEPLERFFAFMDSYRSLKPVPLVRATLEPRHLPTGRRVIVGHDRLMPPPAHIDVVEYEPESLFFLRTDTRTASRRATSCSPTAFTREPSKTRSNGRRTNSGSSTSCGGSYCGLDRGPPRQRSSGSISLTSPLLGLKFATAITGAPDMPRTPASPPTPAITEPTDLGRAMGEVAFYREHNTTFGPYLRKLRDQRGLSLRDAADQVGLTFAKLQKMETGGRFRIDSLSLFGAIADLYGRPRNEVLEAAGIKVLEPQEVGSDLDDDNAFARLVLNPALRPMRMDDRWLDSFSSLQKRQWVEFAKRLEAFFHAGGSLAAVLEPDSDGNAE